MALASGLSLSGLRAQAPLASCPYRAVGSVPIPTPLSPHFLPGT